MTFILRLKHWQVFPILIVGLILNNFTIEGYQTITTILMITGGVIYSMWNLLVGHSLYQLLPGKIKLNYNLFLINSFVWFAVFIFAELTPGKTFKGVEALPGLYILFAIFHFTMFPARTLKSIEKNKKVDIGECIGDFFLIVFLPIGIWFLQPRINKVATQSEHD